jgi:ketosteroid isomerase-like protein
MNRRRQWLAASAASLASLTAIAATTDPRRRIPDDLARAVADYDRAQVENDRAALERLLADDYVLVNSAGRSQDKSSMIADSTAPGFRLEPFTVTDETIQVWSDGALFAGRAQLRGTSDGQAFAATLRFADVWRRNPGGWQVVFTEATRVAP